MINFKKVSEKLFSDKTKILSLDIIIRKKNKTIK